MIPYLPQSSTDLDVPEFYKVIQENLVVRSAHHESWHTHKRDTSVCWICDLLELSKLLISEMERFISKSALDLDDQFLALELNSEGDTVNYNVNDELTNGVNKGIPNSNAITSVRKKTRKRRVRCLPKSRVLKE